ncbi:MAG: hypothetical protein OWT28_00145, partial [Firmicutes bacterium]|nr:hypothetical protein [Bacillota bacterium]
MLTTDDAVIAIYEDVLHERVHAFPPYFFTGEEGLRCAAVIVRYLVEQKLGWAREDVCEHLSRETLDEFRLAGMVKSYFGGSVFAVLDNAYPGEYLAWELVRARRALFSGADGQDLARQAIRWFVRDKLALQGDDLSGVSLEVFMQHKMDGILHKFYGMSVWRALEDAGLVQSYPWESAKTPNHYWQGEQGREHAEAAVRWLVEQKLGVSIEDIPKAVRFTTFKDYGLDTMIKTVFGGSPFRAIDAVYPGRFRPWQFGCAPQGFWSGPDKERHIQEAMEWLVYDKLQLSREAPPVF